MGQAIAAACAALLLYGGWLVFLELVMRVLEDRPLTAPEIFATTQC